MQVGVVCIGNEPPEISVKVLYIYIYIYIRIHHSIFFFNLDTYPRIMTQTK